MYIVQFLETIPIYNIQVIQQISDSNKISRTIVRMSLVLMENSKISVTISWNV